MEDMVIKRSLIAVGAQRWQWFVWAAAFLAPVLWDWYGLLLSLVGAAVTALHILDVTNDRLVLSQDGVSLFSRGVFLSKRNVFVPTNSIQSLEVSGSGWMRLLGLGNVIVQHANGVEVFRYAVRPERAEQYARMVAAHPPRRG